MLGRGGKSRRIKDIFRKPNSDGAFNRAQIRDQSRDARTRGKSSRSPRGAAPADRASESDRRSGGAGDVDQGVRTVTVVDDRDRELGSTRGGVGRALRGVHRDALGNESQIPLPGATFSEFNLQLQIVGVTAFWQQRNSKFFHGGYVHGLDYPRRAQFFGVRWIFSN